MEITLALALLAAGPAYALEGAAAGGVENNDKLVIETINISRERLEQFIQPQVDALAVVTTAITNCAKQQRFYNESTKACI